MSGGAAPVAGRRPVLTLALVVVGLLAGLGGMHHLLDSDGAEPGAHLTHIAAPVVDRGSPLPVSPAHDGHESDVLHLCLAVLTITASVVLGWLWWQVVVALLVPVATGWTRPVSRAPPDVPVRLTLLCVSRT